MAKHSIEEGQVSHHHHISVMELGHLLTRSGLTYIEVSSEVCHDSFCQMGNSVSLSWVVCREAFCLHVVSSSSCIPSQGQVSDNSNSFHFLFILSFFFLHFGYCCNLFQPKEMKKPGFGVSLFILKSMLTWHTQLYI
jgi:hypothetical protein